jgi:hypothetical protein
MDSIYADSNVEITAEIVAVRLPGATAIYYVDDINWAEVVSVPRIESALRRLWVPLVLLAAMAGTVVLGYAFVMRLTENVMWSWAALVVFGVMMVLGVMVVRALDRAQEQAGSGLALRLDTVSGHADILVGKKPGYLHRVADAINGTVQARRTLVEKI